MKHIKQCLALWLILALLAGCAAAEAELSDDSEARAAHSVPKEMPVEGNIRDNPALYEGRDPYSVISMYLTVSSGNEADGSNHTWTEVNSYSAYYYEDLGIDRAMATKDLLACKTLEEIAECSGGLYVVPEKFRKKD